MPHSLLPLASTLGASFTDALLSSWPTSFFAASVISREAIAIVAIVGGLLMGAIAVLGAYYTHHHKQKMWHETARVALEKGQPVPPMPLRDEEIGTRPPPGVSFAEWHQARMAEMRGNDFKSGLVLLAVGAGLYLMLPWGHQMIGAIPGLIGVALLINAFIRRLSTRPHSGSDDRPPQT